MDDEFGGNGHAETEQLEDTVQESPDQLKAAYKKLDDLRRGDGQLISMSKEHLGVIAQTLHIPGSIDEYRQILIITEFLDDEEARDFVAAIWECKRYGMDIGPVIDEAIARCSVNRKGVRSNRVAQLLDAFSHTKITSNVPNSGKGVPRGNPNRLLQ